MPTDDRALRAALIRLAHAQPSLRADILPLVTAGEVPEAFKKQWDKNKGDKKDDDKAESKDDKKDSGKPWEKGKDKEASDKTAAMAVVRRMATLHVRILNHKPVSDGLVVAGVMSIDFGVGGAEIPTPLRFIANVAKLGDTYQVRTFSPIRSVSGAGAESLLAVMKSALQEAFSLKGGALLGTASGDMPDLSAEPAIAS